ncbi:branched-chain amino acid ABC transporter permease [Pseudaminobacter arsenicus]|uniref:Branched-chain amino acid ABC transporter permease n=1 Tax=Borborobacter arsenicus TaxID=1851146 RepID=A0A432V4E7_9HYPH|nr:branched-chain amino acid ABC transporter permease [Pseudaminobacter arsenicus]RUM97103.1 branched-chain amino acid ABC transporter permease [Pseudaminobacter arsenicus]
MTRGGWTFGLAMLVIVLAGFLAPHVLKNPFYFFAGYVILQYVVIATGWNILGGYAGYINFGAAGFFGAGAYASAFLFNAFGIPLWGSLIAACVIGAGLGLLMGYLTLRIQGVYFAIATLGLVIILETIIHNIPALGGARGMVVYGPPPPGWAAGPPQYMFVLMLLIAVASVSLARWMQLSWVGRGLRAVRASEDAAECSGVPTLRLKLLACAVSGAVLAAAGAPYPFYTSFVEPVTAFSLIIGLNAIAMPLIGGTRSWQGPVIGALLLATTQQIATITISSELNILFVGVVLIAFVALAPNGLIGLVRRKGTEARL